SSNSWKIFGHDRRHQPHPPPDPRGNPAPPPPHRGRPEQTHRAQTRHHRAHRQGPRQIHPPQALPPQSHPSRDLVRSPTTHLGVTPAMTLYSLRSPATVTKWDSLGNPQASYEVSRDSCTCPAGHRPTCRHRLMLPNLLTV